MFSHRRVNVLHELMLHTHKHTGPICKKAHMYIQKNSQPHHAVTYRLARLDRMLLSTGMFVHWTATERTRCSCCWIILNLFSVSITMQQKLCCIVLLLLRQKEKFRNGNCTQPHMSVLNLNNMQCRSILSFLVSRDTSETKKDDSVVMYIQDRLTIYTRNNICKPWRVTRKGKPPRNAIKGQHQTPHCGKGALIRALAPTSIWIF